MLERFSEIQGIGLLHEANGKPYSCKKATLIYADNGRGKSTLTSVLRAVSTGDTSLITARMTVDGKLPPKVVLQFGSGHGVSFENGIWSEQRSEVLVFDADFVEKNVYSGGTVNSGHRKNLLEFALGVPSVSARLEVEKTTKEAGKATEKVKNLVGQLSGYHPNLTLAQFAKLSPEDDIDAKIETLQKRISAASRVATILAKSVPTPVAEPNFNISSFFQTLGGALENVHGDAERVVKQQITKLHGDEAETWLSQGLQFNSKEFCPYCGQKTTGIDLIHAYQTYFNAAYEKLKDHVATVHQLVGLNTSQRVIDRIEQGVATASAQAQAWAEHVQVPTITFNVDKARAALDDFRSLVFTLSLKKNASPAEPLGTVEEHEKAVELWQQAIAPLQETNLAIHKAVEVINTYKGQLGSEDISQLQQEEQRLRATKNRYQPQVMKLFDQHSAAVSAAGGAEKGKKAAREKLDSLMATTLGQYENDINKLLKNFGASFSIKGMSANFRGAGPRSEYGLSLRGKDVPLEGGPPSFATALSEGDKRTLAFAFFVASTLQDANLAKRIVVIDDPMCSLDLNRKHQTRTVLKKIYVRAEQLVVLAHDPYFIRDLRDALLKDDTGASIALFQLAAAPDDYTNFAQLDIDRECESSYFKHHRLLSEFAGGNGGDLQTVAKAIRPLLEGYLHRRFPRQISKGMLFGQIVAAIRSAGAASPLRHAANLVDELNELNEFAGQFHHDTNPDGADSVQVTAAGLKSFVDRALAVVHGGA
jgi:wobble nucleotide-excising tRNase